jgi:hypothetical protein
VKPLNWEGHGKKFRHTLVVTAGPQYTMLVYLYPIGDEAVFNHIHVGAGTAAEATSRAGAPVDLDHPSNVDAKAVRLTPRPARRRIVASPLPERDQAPLPAIDFWQNKEAIRRNRPSATKCGSSSRWRRRILDSYAADVPGKLRPRPPWSEMTLQYDAQRELGVRPAHRRRNREPPAMVTLTLGC